MQKVEQCRCQQCSILTIGDNYESSVLFVLVGGYQYVASAISNCAKFRVHSPRELAE